MNATLLVGFGGFLGAIARFGLSNLILPLTPDWRFPLATFVVNVVGCLVAGIVAALADTLGLIGSEMRLFLLTGILGGFTTFSAFSLETTILFRRGDTSIAACYIGASVLCGIAAFWFALRTVEFISGQS